MANQFRDTTKKVLSPAAQAVLDAFLGDAEDTGLQMDDLRENVAAALRAALDQVVPETREHYPATVDERCRKISAFNVRNQFFVIAAELEQLND
jgi:hypothetical protein